MDKRIQPPALAGEEAQWGAEELLAGGRVFVRPSGTEPLIRILAEGESKAACEEAAALIVQAVEAEGGVCAGS